MPDVHVVIVELDPTGLEKGKDALEIPLHVSDRVF